MNVLIDTNVLLSAARRDKLPERVVLHVATLDDWRWLVTPEILAEYIPEELLAFLPGVLRFRTPTIR